MPKNNSAKALEIKKFHRKELLMRKRIIFLFLAVLLAVNSFCILPT